VEGDSGNVFDHGSYSERGSLSGADREITASRRLPPFRRARPALRVLRGAGNHLLDVRQPARPRLGLRRRPARGSSGAGLKPSDFAATAARRTPGLSPATRDLLLHSIRTGLFVSADHRLANGTELFAELLASEFQERRKRPRRPLLLPGERAGDQRLQTRSGRPCARQGSCKAPNKHATLTFRDELVRPLVGRARKAGHVGLGGHGPVLGDKGGQVIHGQPNAAALAAALASSDPRTALNPFVDGAMASPDTLASIFGKRWRRTGGAIPSWSTASCAAR
jgi:hypothetical protein